MSPCYYPRITVRRHGVCRSSHICSIGDDDQTPQHLEYSICKSFWTRGYTGQHFGIFEFQYQAISLTCFVMATNRKGEARKPVKRNDSASPSASFIFMHGLGDDADGWTSMFKIILKRLRGLPPITDIADQFRGANKLPHLNWVR